MFMSMQINGLYISVFTRTVIHSVCCIKALLAINFRDITVEYVLESLVVSYVRQLNIFKLTFIKYSC